MFRLIFYIHFPNLLAVAMGLAMNFLFEGFWINILVVLGVGIGADTITGEGEFTTGSSSELFPWEIVSKNESKSLSSIPSTLFRAGALNNPMLLVS